MAKVLINGKAYDWSSITARILGFNITGITEVNYGLKQKKTDNYGSGDEPDSRGYGNKEYECAFTFNMNEIRKIRAKLTGGKLLTDISPFPVTVSYIVGTRVVVDKIFNVEFTSDIVKAKQGDTELLGQTDTMCAGIIYGS